MHPINFPGTNMELLKPAGWTDEQCSSLPVFRGYDKANWPFFISAWMPNREDLQAMERGECIWLKMTGTSYQPCAIYTIDTKEPQFNFPVGFGRDDEKNPCFVTKFQPNDADLQALKKGEPIMVKMIGDHFQPIALFTIDEDGKPNEG